MEVLKLELRPQRNLPRRRVAKNGEEAMVTQPRAAGIQEVRIVLLGPNLPPL